MDKSLKIRMILYILPAVILTLFIVMITSIYMSIKAHEKRSYSYTMETVRNYATRFDADMLANMSIARTLSTAMEQNERLNRTDVMDILHHLLIKNPNLLGTYVGYEPNAFDGKDASYANSPGHDATGRFFPYWNRMHGKESLEPAMDIDISDYYTIPKTTMKDQVIEPYLYNGTLMTSFISPILKNGKFIGLGGIDVSIDHLDRLISRIRIQKTGYAYLVSKKGVFLSYPDKSFIGKKTLTQVAQETGDASLPGILKNLGQGKEGYVDTKDPVTGTRIAIFYTPIPSCQWGMVIVLKKREILSDTFQMAQVMVVIGLLAIALITVIVTKMAGSLVQPLVVLAGNADEIASGNLDIHLPEPGGEIGLLSRAFNNMAEQLRRKFSELQDSEARFRSLFKLAPLPMANSSSDGRIVDVNDQLIQVIGYSIDDIPDIEHWWSAAYPDPEYRKEVMAQWEADLTHAMKTKSEVVPREYRITCKDGTVKTMVIGATLIGENMIVSFFDITERKKAEIEREKLQEKLLQSQKLEAVGVLAGGVAHDFNNMLGAIIGYVELTLKDIDAQSPVHHNLGCILDTAQRSAILTRQLLAFARKQTVALEVIDLNQAVENILSLLHRLIGENIHLSWIPSKTPCVVKMDPSQIDQILTNLCVNARDAINDVGKITIETEKVYFDEADCRIHSDFKPGSYILLAVSDTGCGMTREAMKHIFEPFFTTKGLGQGTGLGLSTVYGIIKQNDGFINIYSEPGEGTTFKLYFRHHDAVVTLAKKQKTTDLPVNNGETILMIEDDPTLLTMGEMMLKRIGYKVIRANSPFEAIRIVQESKDDIHLFITDVIMPEMNGKDLATRLQEIRPGICHLFMSGYTSNVIAHHGVLDEGVNFIQKPFSMKDLAVKIHEVLHPSPA
jgi:PAS domain S-box-containing protein